MRAAFFFLLPVLSFLYRPPIPQDSQTGGQIANSVNLRHTHTHIELVKRDNLNEISLHLPMPRRALLNMEIMEKSTLSEKFLEYLNAHEKMHD